MQPQQPAWNPPPVTESTVTRQPPTPPGPPSPPSAQPPRTNYAPLLLAVAVGTLISVALGVYGKTHDPTGTGILPAGFSTAFYAKAWMATGVFVLAVGQLFGALWMYGKLPLGPAPSWVGPGHRWAGRAAVLLSVPIAVHCLYAAGFQDFDSRTLWHSLLGCFVYGAFAAKMLVLSRDDAPGWALPVFGGLVFTAFTGLWLTGAYWYFAEFGVQL